MANNNRQGADLLRKIIGGIGNAISNPGELAQKAGGDFTPIAGLARLLGTAMEKGPEDLRGNKGIDLLDDATRKEIVKIRKEQVREAAEAGVPLDVIQKISADAPNQGETQPDPMAPKPEGQTSTAPKQQDVQQQPPQQGQNILQDLLGRVAKGLSQDFRAKEAGIEKSQATTKYIPKQAEAQIRKWDADIEAAQSNQDIRAAELRKNQGMLQLQQFKLASELSPGNWRGIKSIKGMRETLDQMEMIEAKEIDLQKAGSGVKGRVGAVRDGVIFTDAQGNRALVDPKTNKVIKEL